MTRRPEIITLGNSRLELWSNGYCRTVLPGGAEVHALPPNDEYQRQSAETLGYRDRFAASIDHEAGHSLLAYWLGLTESPTLRGVVSGDYWPHWVDEEAAVLALQRFAMKVNRPLINIARRYHHNDRVV